jgi:superfamily II DNA helicase RecQ
MKTTILAMVTAAAALTVAPLLAGTAQADPTRLAQVDINIGGSRPGVVVEHRRRPAIVVEHRRRPAVVIEHRRDPAVVIEHQRRPGVVVETEGRRSYR